MPPSEELLRRLATEGLTFIGQIAPGVYGYGSRQAMHRARVYHAAVLQPFAARGLPQEMMLVGHLHVVGDLVVRVEGFNGQEGQRWAERAKGELAKAQALAPEANVSPSTPLNACLHAKPAATR